VNPCTKGIWVWGRPVLGTTIEGQPCSIIIVDTEGIGALDQDSDHDARIFSLAILMSSAFMYNSVGAIDEDALQNLSLVINLTKHIHVKSRQKEDTDSEEYSQYFPSFMWVVRDFSLKLVDNDGEALTAKDYLEKALQSQKGFSDMVEEKNRIRRLLKDFFKERECFTLVRPVSNEADLQHLEEKEVDKLRPEFVQQMLALRKKMFDGIRPKTLNGKNLNGEMLATLIENYVTAMNKGVVPTIETAWNYICKNECAKAIQDAQEVYERVVMQTIGNHFPMNEDELKALHKDAKKTAVDLFKDKAVGSETEALLEKLKNIIAEKFANIKMDNEADSEKKCQGFLSNAYSTIDQKLRNNEYKNFVEYEREMKKLQRFFIERGPEGPFRNEILLEFCQKKIIDTADFFIKEFQSEVEFISSSSADRIKNFESELKETKEDLVRERSEWQRKLTSAESERTELSAKESSLRDQLMSLRSEKDKIETELRNSMKSLRTEMGAQVENANSKAWENEERMKEIERISLQKDSEFKEKSALMEQKLKYLESSLEESRKREKDYMSESRSMKKDHSSSLKDIQSRFENQIKNLQARLESETERVNELERELEEKDRNYERDRQNWEENEIRTKAMLEEKSQTIDALSQSNKRSEKEWKQQEKAKLKEYEIKIQRLTIKLEETEKKLKSNEDHSKNKITNLNRENAILTQKLEFADQSLEEYKNQLDEVKKQHMSMLSSLHGSSGLSNDDLETQLSKVKAQYGDQIKSLELQLDTQRRDLGKQLEVLTLRNTELEMELKVQVSDWENKASSLSTSLNETTEERNKLKDSLSELKSKLETATQETEARLRKKISMLEKEIEDIKTKHAEEVQSSNERSETSYSQLKEYYEAEKKRLEARVQDDKERAEKKYNLMVEEYEDRLKAELDNYEDELAGKEDELREMDAYYNEEINSLRHKAGLDMQKIESLEKYLKDNKEQIENMQKAHALALEQNQERMNTERVSLVEKIEKLANEIAAKEREMASIVYKKEQLETQLAHRDAELDDIKTQYEREKVSLQERLENLKSQFNTISDELMQKKNDSKREMALAQQEIEFKNRKIADLERSLHDSEDKYNEALKSLRDESGQELSATIEKLTLDKESLEQKLEQKKKSLKEMATSSIKQIGALEKEKAIYVEKYSNLESKYYETEERLKNEIENLNNLLKEKKEAESSDKMSVHLENERLKTLLQEMEKEMSERGAASERERMLWENKHGFLTQQRDAAKADLAEAHKKFDATLEQIQKKSAIDKEKLESSTNTLIASIETRYTNQIKDAQENYTSQISTLNSKTKSLEKELRSAKEELELERRGRSANSGSLEKKLLELQDSESRLQSEVEQLKKEKEKKIEEISESFNYEKDQLKNKISDLEKRAKEAEHQRGIMFIDHEKDRAKWNMERDHLIAQKNEALENLERVEKKKETLLRECEKLKAERGKNRNAAGAFVRKPEGNTQLYKQGIGNLFAGAGVSFEEFSREKNQEEGVPSPKSRDEEIASPKNARRGYTPLTFKDRKRSGVGSEKSDS
jgi:chromosome segregation ATPase